MARCLLSISAIAISQLSLIYCNVGSFGFSPFAFSICFAVNAVAIGVAAAISVKFRQPETGTLTGCIGMLCLSIRPRFAFPALWSKSPESMAGGNTGLGFCNMTDEQTADFVSYELITSLLSIWYTSLKSSTS